MFDEKIFVANKLGLGNDFDVEYIVPIIATFGVDLEKTSPISEKTSGVYFNTPEGKGTITATPQQFVDLTTSSVIIAVNPEELVGGWLNISGNQMNGQMLYNDGDQSELSFYETKGGKTYIKKYNADSIRTCEIRFGTNLIAGTRGGFDYIPESKILEDNGIMPDEIIECNNITLAVSEFAATAKKCVEKNTKKL